MLIASRSWFCLGCVECSWFKLSGSSTSQALRNGFSCLYMWSGCARRQRNPRCRHVRGWSSSLLDVQCIRVAWWSRNNSLIDGTLDQGKYTVKKWFINILHNDEVNIWLTPKYTNRTKQKWNVHVLFSFCFSIYLIFLLFHLAFGLSAAFLSLLSIPNTFCSVNNWS